MVSVFLVERQRWFHLAVALGLGCCHSKATLGFFMSTGKNSPERSLTSAGLRELACISTSTSPLRGDGTGSCSICTASGPPGFCTADTSMFCVIFCTWNLVVRSPCCLSSFKHSLTLVHHDHDGKRSVTAIFSRTTVHHSQRGGDSPAGQAGRPPFSLPFPSPKKQAAPLSAVPPLRPEIVQHK